MGAISRLCHFAQRCDSDGLPPLGYASGEDYGIGRTRTRVTHQEACDVLVIYLAPLPRGFLLGTLGPFRFSLSGPMLRPRLRNLANEPLEAWPCNHNSNRHEEDFLSFIIFCGFVRSDDVCRSGVPYSLALLFHRALLRSALLTQRSTDRMRYRSRCYDGSRSHVHPVSR
jgi:hypothetical protein